MFINVPIAGIVITGGVVFLSSHVTEARQRVDWAGAALGGLGLFAVVYGFAHAATKPGSAGWADPQTIGSIAAGIVLLAAFAIADRRVAYPLLPPRVVLDRNRGGSYSALLLAPIGLFSVFLFLTYYLETTQGYTPVRTGLAFLPLTVTVLLSVGVSNTVLLPRVSPRLLVPAGLLLAAAGMALMTRITANTTSAAPSRVLFAQAAVHSYTVAFWVGAAILTAAALAVAPLLRPNLAELGVSTALRTDIPN
jgi:hypothetical protein